MGEKDVQRAILQYLKAKQVWCRRYANRVVYIAGRPFVPIRDADGKPDNGHPDLIAKTRNATINIECKAEGGKQNIDQKRWQREAEARGEVYILAESLEDITPLFERGA